METILYVSGGLVALYLATELGFRLGKKAGQGAPDDAQLARDQATDRNNLLRTWRREIANQLMWSDHERFNRFYAVLHEQLQDISKWSAAAKQERFNELCGEYPLYETFDPFATREHVLYADARSMDGDDDLERKFKDIATFQALLHSTQAAWTNFPSTSLDDLRHAQEYGNQIADSKFRLRLEQAIHEFYLARGDKIQLDADLYSVHPVSHYAENRYGVHFKDTNEFGLYGMFVDDDERVFYSFYRSNRDFTEEKHLETSGELLNAHRAVFDPTNVRSWKR